MELWQVSEFLSKFTKSGSPVTDLSRFERLMDALGNPQNMLEFIHVAGTNGKGSTVRMLSETFRAAGYITGEFTSPYIYRYNDRISVDGEEIPDEYLCEICERMIPIIEDIGEYGYSQFEITTAIGFVYFVLKKCDIVILETGLGGLLDCTNIIEPPVCSVITSISYDHTAILGNTLESIAKHKTGIIKKGSPCVMQCGNPEAAVTEAEIKAFRENSQLIIPDERRLRIISSDESGNEFIYKERRYRTSMIGVHQVYNALTAIEAAKTAAKAGFDIRTKDIKEGIYKAAVPSRCQVLHEKAPTVIIDGAHNPDGMRALAEVIRSSRRSPKIMVCGMLDTKDWRGALSYVFPYIDKAYCVDGFYPGSVFAPTLAAAFPNGEVASLRDAYYKACVQAGENGLVVIGGSLYLASVLDKHSNI